MRRILAMLVMPVENAVFLPSSCTNNNSTKSNETFSNRKGAL